MTSARTCRFTLARCPLRRQRSPCPTRQGRRGPGSGCRNLDALAGAESVLGLGCADTCMHDSVVSSGPV